MERQRRSISSRDHSFTAQPSGVFFLFLLECGPPGDVRDRLIVLIAPTLDWMRNKPKHALAGLRNRTVYMRMRSAAAYTSERYAWMEYFMLISGLAASVDRVALMAAETIGSSASEKWPTLNAASQRRSKRSRRGGVDEYINIDGKWS